ncbi:hypothetical protein FDECE_12448 [Fusarium decemcellulare]|nr:hypothetical protein FDECE_12448 [Fusarium decemcellulare]
MHFSTLAISMLATSAAAYRRVHVKQEAVVVTEYVTHVVTEGAVQAKQTWAPVEDNNDWGNWWTQQPEQPQAQPTTLKVVTRKSTTAAAAAPTSGSGSGSSSLTDDQQAALDAHNEARSAVGNEPLTWDDELAAGAQEWADHLVSLGSLQHSGADGVGENLYAGSSSNPFTDAANLFIAEKSQYNGEAIDNVNYQTFGHYTQVVWHSTTKVGMAKASGNGQTYVVCRYQEPGNMIGDKPY